MGAWIGILRGFVLWSGLARIATNGGDMRARMLSRYGSRIRMWRRRRRFWRRCDSASVMVCLVIRHRQKG